MPFRARNPYYLRISQRSVLPLYVFLDERHIDWMSDKVLQYVLTDLRPLILPKLKAEADAHLGPGGPANAKKGTVDVHKGEFYQFCFFFRKTEPHSVLIKTRSFVIAPPLQSKSMPPPPNPPSSKSVKHKGKRKGHTKESSRKKPKTKGKGKAKMDVVEEDESARSTEDENAEEGSTFQVPGGTPRRSGRTRKPVAGGYAERDDEITADGDTEMLATLNDCSEPITPDLHASDQLDEGPTPERAESNATETTPDDDAVMHDTGTTINATQIDLEVEEEEPKPKPMLQLRYQGFGIYGHCLCVVVEPFPPIRSSSRAPSVAPLREISVRPPSLGFNPTRERLREGTPLFLPDHDRRSQTPAPFPSMSPLPYPPESVIDEPDRADGHHDGMMEFSHVLNAAGDFQAGSTLDDDDEMDGAIFFGDADEGREL